MDKPKDLYEVSPVSGFKAHIYAASGGQAKRIYCKGRGIRHGDYWCGARSLKARKMKPDEVKTWEDQADAERGTLIFIKGMLGIYSKAYEERKGAAEQGVTV